VAWDDPAPARRNRPASSRASAPGYGPANPLPFLTILGRGIVSVFIGVMAYWGAHAAVQAWRLAHGGGGHALADMAIAIVAAVVVGVLALRYLLSRPRYVGGLPLRVRDGGGWWGRRRGWDDDSVYPTFGQQVAADIAGDVVGAAIDAVTD